MGVMAIIGILAAVLLPSMITRIEDANTTKEDANLEEIARALVAGIKASGTIPNPNLTPYNAQNGGGWGNIAYQYTTLTDDSVNPGTLHYVFPEQDQSARRVYLDNQFMAYLVAATAANAPVAGGVNGVFQTPVAGWPEQAGGLFLANIPLRMYIVSSSKKDLSLSCQVNQAGTGMVPSPQPAPGYGADLIGDLQNWVKKVDGPGDPAPGAIKVPDSIAEWGSAYAGGGNYHTRGEFLHVKVVDLRPLFCQVTLIDTAAPEDFAVAGFNIVVADPDANYAPTAAIAVNIGNNVITFASNGTGGLPVQIASSSQIAGYNARHLAIANTVILPGAAEYAGPASPNAPTYDLIAAVGPGAGGFLPSPDPGAAALGLAADHNQTQTFYVLKGQAINLFNGTPALDKSVVIQADVKYKYYNNTWTRVD
jgi:type II secretory pathway pseudopilin PulG